MSEHIKQPSFTAKGLGAFLIGWGLFYLLGASSVALLSASDADWYVSAVAAMLSLGYLLQVVGGVALASGIHWGRRMLFAAAAFCLVPLAYVVFKLGWWLVIPVLGGPILIAVLMLTSPRFDIGLSYDSAQRFRLRPAHGVIVVLFVGGIGLMAVAREEISDIFWQLRVDRWEAICASDGEREACGRWAIELLYHDSFDDHREGLALFEKLCREEKVHRACRYTGVLRLDEGPPRGLGREQRDEKRAEIAAKVCAAGDERGCVVASEKPAPPDVQDVAARSCLDGYWEACAEHESPAAQALEEVPGNPALYAVTVDVPDLAADCEAGDAAACFAMGLNATADINPVTDETVGTRSLEVSMGRACELGANIACYVFALRLLDRPIGAERDEKRARELLDTACDRGHAESCWLIAMELLELPRDVDRYRAAAEQACRQSTEEPWRCQAWSNVLAYDIDATGWVIADSEGFRKLRHGCAVASDPMSCYQGALTLLRRGMFGEGTVAPLYVTGQSLARQGCRAHIGASCDLLFIYADSGQHYGMKSPEALREKVCPQVPGSCADQQ